MKIINIDQRTPEWLDWRRAGLGGSDISAICGVNPYKTPLDVYNEKVNGTSQNMTPAMLRGVNYESEALEVFKRERRQFSSWDYIPIICEHDDCGAWRASLDGYCKKNNSLVEIKIPGLKTLDMASYGQIPLYYQYQIQWQLFVSNCSFAYYFVYHPESLTSYTIAIYPDANLIEQMLVKATEFWQNLQNCIPPLPPRSKKEACAETSAILREMLDCKEQEKAASERYKSLLADLMQIEGVENGLESDVATLSVSERSSVDYKKACEDAGVDLEAYRKPSTKVWVIRAKAAS
jgi:putative phage-type endonuclease